MTRVNEQDTFLLKLEENQPENWSTLKQTYKVASFQCIVCPLDFQISLDDYK